VLVCRNALVKRDWVEKFALHKLSYGVRSGRCAAIASLIADMIYKPG
jgi:hypothetical protein